jgi:hypothetical protein
VISNENGANQFSLSAAVKTGWREILKKCFGRYAKADLLKSNVTSPSATVTARLELYERLTLRGASARRTEVPARYISISARSTELPITFKGPGL